MSFLIRKLGRSLVFLCSEFPYKEIGGEFSIRFSEFPYKEIGIGVTYR